MLCHALLLALTLAALPVAAEGFDPDAATRAYLATVSGAARERSDAYFEGGYWLLLWGAVIAAAIDLLLLETGLAARLSAWAGRRRRSLAGRVLFFMVVYGLVTALLTLPWGLWTGLYRERLYGLSNQSLSQFLGDVAKSLPIGAIIAAGIAVPVFLLVRRAPRSWWLWGAGVVTVATAFGALIAPVLIMPLFNKYTPMPASPLQTSIVAMARANDVPTEDVFVVDASRQSDRISANVAGLGATARIALNDNLLATKDAEGIRAVMGHEVGHYVLGHVYQSIAFFGVLAAVLLFLVSRIVPALLRRYGARWRITGLTDPAIIPLVGLVLAPLGLLATPAVNNWTRRGELQADAFGLEAARAPDGFARMAMRLSQYRKLEPSPLEEVLFYTHPSGRVRVENAMRWKAEQLRAGVGPTENGIARSSD